MPSATEQAVRRLEAALESLELAIQQRLTQTVGAEGLADEVRMLSADRARLAELLDQAQARTAKAEHVNHDVSQRLAGTIRSVRALLDAEPETR